MLSRRPFKGSANTKTGVPPQGGGDGTGRVSNISFSGLQTCNISQAIYINKYYYKVEDPENYCDTSILEFGDLTLSHLSRQSVEL